MYDTTRYQKDSKQTPSLNVSSSVISASEGQNIRERTQTACCVSVSIGVTDLQYTSIKRQSFV